MPDSQPRVTYSVDGFEPDETFPKLLEVLGVINEAYESGSGLPYEVRLAVVPRQGWQVFLRFEDGERAFEAVKREYADDPKVLRSVWTSCEAQEGRA